MPTRFPFIRQNTKNCSFHQKTTFVCSHSTFIAQLNSLKNIANHELVTH